MFIAYCLSPVGFVDLIVSLIYLFNTFINNRCQLGSNFTTENSSAKAAHLCLQDGQIDLDNKLYNSGSTTDTEL